MEVVPETEHQNVNNDENPAADNAVIYADNKKKNET